MLTALARFTHSRWSWLSMATIAFALELCALFFQYIMKLDPCVMCVYERLAMLLLIMAGLVGAIQPKLLFIRLSGYFLWVLGAIWGLYLAIKHTGYQKPLDLNADPFAGGGMASCESAPNFPFSLPLDSWLPWLFEATGDCSEIAWQFLGYSMPQWLIVSFAVFCLAWLIFFPLQFFPKEK